MRKLMIISCLLVIGLAGCEEETPTGIDYSLDQVLFACNSNNSADFVWLDKFVANAEAQASGYYGVDLMNYNSSVYIMLHNNLSASPPAIYNCNGELALADLGLTYNEFVDQSTKLKTVYSK
ncbi:hypothetical protein SAMN04489724_1364 [Algoriphagus locisalis]|uniref:Uncharacterized protein n=1 Tax=Algoriphagus locisalis TaxID=305507 RepID=A0A1I6Z1H0_9BACT|nr:hypothetical protein [Algoriphagus locisalis]SFT56566.1 hypothetical protein SAMN04489724_1364 [Algoriphagus locisalis]